MIIVLFVLVAIAATIQLRAASHDHPQYPGPTSSPNALPIIVTGSPALSPGAIPPSP
jgi:hypothetical protein